MPTPSPLILAFGDSLIAGYGLPAGASFPAQLERRLRDRHPTARVVNAGVSGDTTADALRRLPRALSGLDRRPDLAIVQLGPNDVLQQLPPSQTRSNLDAICVEFGRCGVPVLLTTVAPPTFSTQPRSRLCQPARRGCCAACCRDLPILPGGHSRASDDGTGRSSAPERQGDRRSRRKHAADRGARVREKLIA